MREIYKLNFLLIVFIIFLSKGADGNQDLYSSLSLKKILQSNHSQNMGFIGVRSNAPIIESLSKTYKIDYIANTVEEFSNGNTFVRLSMNVEDKNIVLFIPAKLNSNELMETLLKAFTLKKLGANSVTIFSEGQLGMADLVDLEKSVNIEPWLESAGVDFLANQYKQRKIFNHKRIFKTKPSLNAVVFGIFHPELVKDYAQKSGLEVVASLSKQNISGRKIKFIAPSTEPVNTSFFKNLLVAQRLQNLGAASIEFITPYLPYARSDKVDQDGVSVAGKLVASLIEMSGATSAIFVRAHAPQSEGFFSIPTKNYSGRNTINDYLRSLSVDMVVSPDAGFQKDATLYADELRIPLVVINKQRDPLTAQSKIVGISGPDVKGKNLVIIDDETSSGGTLGKAAGYLTSLGANKVYAVVTHLTGNARAALDSPALEEVVVTNTMPIWARHPKLRVLDISEELSGKENKSRTKLSCQKIFQND